MMHYVIATFLICCKQSHVNRLSRTVSTRLQNKIHKKVRDCCNEKGITVNDFVKDAVETKLNGSNMFNNCKNCDQETHDTLRKIINALHDSYSYSLEEDDDGRPLRFNVEWVYD